MWRRAQGFLDSLSDDQRAAATYDFDTDERFRWQYTPGSRGGLALGDMDGAQRERAMALLESGLSARGAATARGIMQLEPVLRSIEQRDGREGWQRRDPDRYWFSVFGQPSEEQPWAWRVGGHHLCLHFTVLGDAVSVTPLFFGANPARVPDGVLKSHAGLRVLAAEEDLGRALLGALPSPQRTRAVVSEEAPSDILTRNAVRAEVAAVPTGVEYVALDPPARAAFDDLLDHYLGRVQQAPLPDRDVMTFAWAGSAEPGQGHYYAIRGSELLIEYDNTQNGANHIHTVWRDVRRDWGEDLLADHYRHAHRG
jgi:hypothetical protein